jgi:hypothetical protein
MAGEDECLPPAIACGEHFDDEVFGVFPAVVAPEEELLDGGADFAG